MTVRLNPYLNFRDNAKEAMEFYHSVFGGKLDLSTFAEFHASDDPAEADKIMHGQLTADNGLVLMGADVPSSMAITANSTVSLSGDDEETLTGYYNQLSDGGTIAEKLAKAPWGDTFGMFTDKFGVPWLVNIAGTPAA
ncbi:PhnB protein [Arthrobacter silviterrae]|uniref:VOC family protein n=1 Tax=Arthrobacter silviterrae TaxID=2026658 RepID=A0ABX0DDD1_9MICC|nr:MULTISPECIES: VOC family protein [Arthrobacter]MCU6481006.1 VOC family protein [Arthrobacter sp. A2-55]MDQ0278067.1 PhnB protein [Arthrobacter silviterrae]NGN84941.1 VOC family protein [Arthrobacter silviterrae]